MRADPGAALKAALRADHCLAAPPRLSFRTHELPDDALAGLELIDLLAGREEVCSWVHEGRGLIGLGRILTITAHGEGRIVTVAGSSPRRRVTLVSPSVK